MHADAPSQDGIWKGGMLHCDTRVWCFPLRVRSALTASSLSIPRASLGDGRGLKWWWCNCCCWLLAWQSGQMVGLTWSAAWRWRRRWPGAVWAPGWKGITARAALPRWVMPMGWMGSLGRRATRFDRLCGGGDVCPLYYRLGDMRAAGTQFAMGVCWRRPRDLPGSYALGGSAHRRAGRRAYEITSGSGCSGWLLSAALGPLLVAGSSPWERNPPRYAQLSRLLCPSTDGSSELG
jgi:hypothetical protein